jgi:hypothetical protein
MWNQTWIQGEGLLWVPFFKEALAIRIDLQVLLKLHTHKIDLGLDLPIVKLTFSQLC